MRRAVRTLAVPALAVLAAACSEDARPRRPLLDPRHAPDVLVESDRLALRPTLDGNRFVAGWRPRRGAELALSAAPAGARLEVVQLAARPRTVALDLEDGTFDADGRVAVRAAGRDLGAVAVADPLEIPLPADLPRGRVLLELRPEGTRLVTREGRVRPALPAGEVLVDDDGVAQSGDSRVDIVRRTAPGESLAGRFAPPAGARAGQRFELRLERRDGGAAVPFEWTPGVLGRLRGARRFEVPLGGDGGLVRVSLVARGAGPPARWSELTLVSPPPASGDPEPPVAASIEPPELVLLYVMDALRADAVGRATPTWDRLAREGLTFRAHRSVAPNTLPSTKALLTGEAYADRGGRALAKDAATLAEAYRRAGYRTALFSGNPWVGPSYGVDRGFEHVTEVTLDERRAAYNDNAERLHEAVLAWLATLPAGARVFLYVHAVHPHNPYDPPEPWRSGATAGAGATADGSMVDGSTATLLAVNRRRLTLDASGRERLRRLYAGGLAYADAQLGRLLAAIERRVPRRRLLVALTSDHGEELFDHGGVLHGYTLYEEMIRIPLVLWGPGRVPPGEHTGPTSTLDLHATLLGLVASDAASEGRPLLPRPPSEELHLAAAASVKGGIYSAQSARWKLVWAPRRGLDWGLGGGLGRSRSAEYLFDLEADPRERFNRAGEGGLEAAWLRSRLKAWIAAKASRETREVEDEVDDETRRRLEALGYVD